MKTLPDYLTADWAASATGVSRATVYQWRKRGVPLAHRAALSDAVVNLAQSMLRKCGVSTPASSPTPPPKPRQAITADYVRAVIEWKHGDAAAGLIAENAAHYPSEADWLVPVFAETQTFAAWRDAMEAETKNPAD